MRKKMVDELASRYEGVENFILVDPRGLTANQTVEMRREMRLQEVKMNVVKNSVALHAFKKAGLEPLSELLTEMTAVCCGPDPVAIAKLVHEARDKYEKKPKVRGAMIDGQIMDAKQVAELSKLPSREQLMGTLLATFNAPASTFVRLLNEVTASFLRVLQAHADKNNS